MNTKAWFAKLSAEHQRQLVLDPAQRLTGELREAVLRARGTLSSTNLLLPDEIEWLEMRSFSARAHALQHELDRAALAGLEQANQGEYQDLHQRAVQAAAEVRRLFNGQSRQIAERYMQEQPLRAAGLDPAHFREDRAETGGP